MLPAYGRSRFTERCVDHLVKLPFRVQLDEGPRLLPFDYWARISEAVERVSTPYAMLCDNDDFPTEDLGFCLGFLERNPDYVCCSGRIQGVWLWPDQLAGPWSAVTAQYSPYDTPADYGQVTVNERVLAGFANSWSYYAVYRTEVLRQIWRGVTAMNFTNLQVHEKFCAMRALTLGKAKCFSTYTTLYRQHGTGSATPWNSEPGIDFLKVLTVMEAEGVDKMELRKRWAQWYVKRERDFNNPVRKSLKAMFPKLAWYVQNRHRYLRHRSLPWTSAYDRWS